MAVYQKDKFDFGILRTDGTTKVGFMLARNKANLPLYWVDDEEYIESPNRGQSRPDRELPPFGQDDFRSGFGLEIYDSTDPQRYFSSIGMDMRHRGMGILGWGFTAVSKPSAASLTIVNADMELEATGWTNGAWSVEQAVSPTHSWKVVSPATPAYQNLASYEKGVEYTLTCWAHASDGSKIRIALDDGVTTTYSAYHTGGGGWEQLSVAKTTSPAATQLHVELHTTDVTGYFDDAAITTTALTLGTTTCEVEFNSDHYLNFGTVLAKINNATGNISLVADIGSTITDLEAFTDDKLYIALGTAANIYYMTTAEAFTQADYKCKFFKTVGVTMWRGVLPRTIESATAPTTDAGFTTTVTVDSSSYDILELLTDGTTIIIKKKDRTFYYDGTDVLILIGETKHLAGLTSGRACTEWQKKYYIGCGDQSLIEYDGGTIGWRSPAKHCSNLSNFVGEIQAVAGDEEYLFAIVDDSADVQIMAGRLETIDSTTSWVWHPVQKLTLTGCQHAFISSVYKKRLYISSTDSTENFNYTPLPTGYGNIVNDSEADFETGGYFITPFLHADFKGDSKAFIKLTLTMSGTSSTVYFTAEYQLLGSTNWTEINSTAKFKTSPTTAGYIPVDDVSSANPVGTMIRFKITGITGAVGSTPILLGYDIRAILYPSRRRIHNVIIQAADEILLKDGVTRDRSNTALNVKTVLEEAADATWPVTFYDPDGTIKYGRFLAVTPFHRISSELKDRNYEREFYAKIQEVALS